MIYKLKFIPSALKEWKKIAPPIKAQFKKKLQERLLNPRVQQSKLSGFKDVYKINTSNSIPPKVIKIIKRILSCKM